MSTQSDQQRQTCTSGQYPLVPCKGILLGECGVGKSSLAQRFVQENFQFNSLCTIGAEFHSRTVRVDDVAVRLQIWDLGAIESFKAIRTYFAGAQVAVVAYDITRKNSFENVESYLNDLKRERGNDVVTILIGNKVDLNDSRMVRTVDGELFAEKHGMLFLETSVKTGRNVSEAFTLLATKFVQQSDIRDRLDEFRTVSLTEADQNQPSCCTS